VKKRVSPLRFWYYFLSSSIPLRPMCICYFAHAYHLVFIFLSEVLANAKSHSFFCETFNLKRRFPASKGRERFTAKCCNDNLWNVTAAVKWVQSEDGGRVEEQGGRERERAWRERSLLSLPIIILTLYQATAATMEDLAYVMILSTQSSEVPNIWAPWDCTSTETVSTLGARVKQRTLYRSPTLYCY
jgi:hypothetical protein